MTKLKNPENEMVKDCFEYLKSLNIYKYISLEVPFLSRCIDMVLVTKCETIITIEYKINNMKHAIEQARDHSLGADFCYVCTPGRIIKNKKLFLESRIGLVFYIPDKKIKMEKQYTAIYNKPVKKFKEMLLENTLKVNSHFEEINTN